MALDLSIPCSLISCETFKSTAFGSDTFIKIINSKLEVFTKGKMTGKEWECYYLCHYYLFYYLYYFKWNKTRFSSLVWSEIFSVFDLLIRLESFTNIFSNVFVYHEVLQGKMRLQSFLSELDSNYRHISRHLYADELLDRTFSF